MDYNRNFREQRPGIKSEMKYHMSLGYRTPSEAQIEKMKIRMGGKVPPMFLNNASEERRHFLKQQGIKDVTINIDSEDLSYDGIQKVAELINGWGFNITDADIGIGPRHDYPLNYGGSNWEQYLDTYEMFTRACGAAGIPVVDILWRSGVARTGRDVVTANTQFAGGSVFDKAEFDKINKPIEHDKEEVWTAFSRFCDRIMPACEDAGVNVALHPCDPPYEGFNGIGDLLQTSNDYRKAFKMAGPHLGMKMCIGCWIEGGDNFGDLLEDIKEFVTDNRVHVVHFRNVFGSLSQEPYCFEETLLDNGAVDMYLVMKQLVKYGYKGAISPDHVPHWEPDFGGMNASMAWSIGYMKALMHCAERELSIEHGLMQA